MQVLVVEIYVLRQGSAPILYIMCINGLVSYKAWVNCSIDLLIAVAPMSRIFKNHGQIAWFLDKVY